MTEPLLLGLTSFLALELDRWVQADTDRPPRALTWTLAAAVLTRYEAWAITGAGFAAAAIVFLRRGAAVDVIVRRLARLAVWPAVAIALFLVNSRIMLADLTAGRGGAMTIALWARNLLDEEYVYRRDPANRATLGEYGKFGAPRTYGVSVNYDFQ